MSGGVISFWVDAGKVPQVVTAATPLPVTAVLPGVSQIDIEQVRGQAALTAGLNGLLAVGGADANAAARTANPSVVAGTDGGNGAGSVRSLFVDATGRLKILTFDQNGNGIGSTAGAGAGLMVAGNVASGVADVGAPVKAGGVYNLTAPTFTTGQRGDLQLTPRGALAVQIWGAGSTNTPEVNAGSTDTLSIASLALDTLAQNYVYDPGGNTWSRARGSAADGAVQKPYALRTNDLFNTQAIAAAGTTTVFAAAGAGIKNFVTALQISGVLATVATTVTLKDGATGLWSIDVPAGVSHFDIVFPTPYQSSANAAMNVTTDAAGPIKFNAQGYKG